MPSLSCPSCGYQRELDPSKLTAAKLKAKCTKCGATFVIDRDELLAPPVELDWGERQAPAAQPVPPEGEQAGLPPIIVPPRKLYGPVVPPMPERSAPLLVEPAAQAGLASEVPSPELPPLVIPPAPVYEPVLGPSQPDGAPKVPSPSPTGERLFADTSSSDRISYEDARLNTLALPAAFGLAVLAKVLWLPAALLDYFRVWIHEFGHALTAWLGSHAATPLALMPGVGWASYGASKSTLVYVCFLFLLAVLGHRAAKARSRFLFGFALLLFWGQSYLTFVASEDLNDLARVFSGAGGELYLSTLLVIAFYYRFPDRMRWDFFRFVGLGLGMFCFVSAAWLWLKASGDHRYIPFGTGLYGREDEGGDMNRLVDAGWSATKIVRVYLLTTTVCLGVIVGHYLWFLRRTLTRGRQGAPRR